MSDTTDSRLADVAKNSCVDGQFYRRCGIHLMINNNSRCCRVRGGSRGALLLVVGAEGPDHGLFEAIHEFHRGALNISLCLGGITAMGRRLLLRGLSGLVRINIHGNLGEENRRGRDRD
jgi:hypothetical protein